jgi:hypothetical protein
MNGKTEFELSLEKLMEGGKKELSKKKLTSSRKAIIRRTKNNILQVRERLAKTAEKALIKSSVKKFIQATLIAPGTVTWLLKIRTAITT